MSGTALAPAATPTAVMQQTLPVPRRRVLGYLRRNPGLLLGLVLIGGLLAFSVIGRYFVGYDQAFPLSGPPSLPPDQDWPFGTDADGRNLLAVIVYGTLLTLKIGVIAGCLGLAIGTSIAFVAAYRGGWIDVATRVLVDVLISIPTLLVLVVVASTLHRAMTTTIMAIIIALLAWREPARQIRAQVLVMREAPYVRVALLNGAGSARVIFREMMPNLLPFLAASFVAAISQAVLASIGLEALGLGTPSEPTLGQTIYWMMNESAFMLGLWWWIVAPIGVLVVLFVGLFLIAAGFDEIANPRWRRAEP